VSQVDQTLQTYQGKEEQLFAELVSKYGPEQKEGTGVVAGVPPKSVPKAPPSSSSAPMPSSPPSSSSATANTNNINSSKANPQQAQLIENLKRELEESKMHRDAVLADTRKWESLMQTIQDVVELSTKLRRDKDILLEELAEKRRGVQLLMREKQAMRGEIAAIDGTIGTVGKYQYDQP
jgi:hypothetical protein